MYYVTEVDAYYYASQLTVDELPVGGNTAYSDVLHCVHGGQARAGLYYYCLKIKTLFM